MNTFEYANGGFPHIKLYAPIITEVEKTKKEFSNVNKNIMSIQSILNTRKNETFLEIPTQKRSIKRSKDNKNILTFNEIKCKIKK